MEAPQPRTSPPVPLACEAHERGTRHYPGEAPVDQGLTTVEALASETLTRAFSGAADLNPRPSVYKVPDWALLP